MSPLIIGIVIVIIAAIIFLSSGFLERKEPRTGYLERLAAHLDAKLEKIAGADNSYQIAFQYDGQPFTYEDVEDNILEKANFRCFLRTPLAAKFNLSLGEKSRSPIMNAPGSLNEMAVSHWGVTTEKVVLPRSLEEFRVFANDMLIVPRLLSDGEVLEVFSKFKEKDSRGIPNMPLEINEGFLALEFHAPGELRPTWLDLQQDPGSIENYLTKMMVVVRSVQRIVKENKEKNRS